MFDHLTFDKNYLLLHGFGAPLSLGLFRHEATHGTPGSQILELGLGMREGRYWGKKDSWSVFPREERGSARFKKKKKKVIYLYTMSLQTAPVPQPSLYPKEKRRFPYFFFPPSIGVRLSFSPVKLVLMPI